MILRYLRISFILLRSTPRGIIMKYDSYLNSPLGSLNINFYPLRFLRNYKHYLEYIGYLTTRCTSYTTLVVRRKYYVCFKQLINDVRKTTNAPAWLTLNNNVILYIYSIYFVVPRKITIMQKR